MQAHGETQLLFTIAVFSATSLAYWTQISLLVYWRLLNDLHNRVISIQLLNFSFDVNDSAGLHLFIFVSMVQL
jgi:hypothetical protein